MNIFPLYASAKLSARALDDRRLRRVFQEAVMIQSNVQRLTKGDGPYRMVPLPNAMQDWLGLKPELYKGANAQMARQWVYDWMHELAIECEFRFDTSGWLTMTRYACTATRAMRIPCDGLKFCNMARSAAKGLDYTHMEDVHEAYRKYVAFQWRHVDSVAPVWTGRERPLWFND